MAQEKNPYKSTRLLLDGQQRLTSLSAVIRGKPVSVRGRKRPIELLLEHPEELVVVTEVDEDADDDEDEDLIADEADSTEDELQRRFDKMTFVVSTHDDAQKTIHALIGLGERAILAGCSKPEVGLEVYAALRRLDPALERILIDRVSPILEKVAK